MPLDPPVRLLQRGAACCYRRPAHDAFASPGVEASWRSGYAEDCKSLHPGSIPGEASNSPQCEFLPIVKLVSCWRRRGGALVPAIPRVRTRETAPGGLCKASMTLVLEIKLFFWRKSSA